MTTMSSTAVDSVPTNCEPRRTDTARGGFGSCACFVSSHQRLSLADSLDARKCEARRRTAAGRRREHGFGPRHVNAVGEGDRGAAFRCSDVLTGAQSRGGTCGGTKVGTPMTVASRLPECTP